MATTYLQLLDGKNTGDAVAASELNKWNNAVDAGARKLYELLGQGCLSGWSITSGTSTISSGSAAIGACHCITTTSQAISGLASGTMYVFARTDAGSPASGTVDFVARTTSATVTNYDGVTDALLLGNGTYTLTSGFTSVSSSLRDDWSIDHGSLSGLSDDDHPEYMQSREVYLYGGDAIAPATSAATTSSFGTTYKATVVKYPALSTTETAWDYYCPADYSGTITVTTDWVSSGLSGNVYLGILSRAHSSGETWDSALGSGLANTVHAIGGSNGHMMRLSHSWTSSKPTQGERGQIVIRRLGAVGSDTMSGTARLLSARMSFPAAR